MKLKRRSFLIGGLAVLVTTLGLPMQASAAKRIVFGGGPAGGTFQVVANAIQVYDPVKESKDYRVKAQSSAGSVENLRKKRISLDSPFFAKQTKVVLNEVGRINTAEFRFVFTLSFDRLPNLLRE